MKYKKSVYRNFALISQLGISVIVPIGLCIFIGVLIDKKFNSNFIIPLIFSWHCGRRKKCLQDSNGIRKGREKRR